MSGILEAVYSELEYAMRLFRENPAKGTFATVHGGNVKVSIQIEQLGIPSARSLRKAERKRYVEDYELAERLKKEPVPKLDTSALADVLKGIYSQKSINRTCYPMCWIFQKGYMALSYRGQLLCRELDRFENKRVDRGLIGYDQQMSSVQIIEKARALS